MFDLHAYAQINVYSLGACFLKFTRLLSIQLPVIDPSLYIHRFAAKVGGLRCRICDLTLNNSRRCSWILVTSGRPCPQQPCVWFSACGGTGSTLAAGALRLRYQCMFCANIVCGCAPVCWIFTGPPAFVALHCCWRRACTALSALVRKCSRCPSSVSPSLLLAVNHAPLFFPDCARDG